jgi:hypothetical protein
MKRLGIDKTRLHNFTLVQVQDAQKKMHSKLNNKKSQKTRREVITLTFLTGLACYCPLYWFVWC